MLQPVVILPRFYKHFFGVVQAMESGIGYRIIHSYLPLLDVEINDIPTEADFSDRVKQSAFLCLFSQELRLERVKKIG